MPATWSASVGEGSGGGANGSGPAAADASLGDGSGQVTSHVKAQNEPAIAVNPLDPQNHLVAWNDFAAPFMTNGHSWVGFGNSHDGGQSWNNRFVTPNPGTPEAGPNCPATSPEIATGSGGLGGDPVSAFNGRGVGLIGLLLRCSGPSSSLMVQTTLDGGDSFGAPVYPARAGDNVPSGLTDKPWIRGDPRSDWFYLCWTHSDTGIRNNLPRATIYFTASGDGLGAVWSIPRPINVVGLTTGCDISIAPDGTVYVTYLDMDPTHPLHLSGANPAKTIKVVRSVDHGLTFTPPVTVAEVAQPSLPGEEPRAFVLPRIDVDPRDGSVYVVWWEGPGDVMISKSTTAGLVWTPKRAIVDDEGTVIQWMPSIAVAPDGRVVVGFYDRREDPANRIMKYYLAESTDGGETFPSQGPAGPSTLDADDVKSPLGAAGLPFFGDYTDLRIGSDGVPHAVWTAVTVDHQDIYTNV